MERRTMGGIAAAVIIVVLLILCGVFFSSSRSNTISSTGPISVDQHDEKNLVKVTGGNFILTILVTVFGLTTAIGICSWVYQYCTFTHLPRRRAAREAKLANRETTIRMASICQQLMSGSLAPNPALPPSVTVGPATCPQGTTTVPSTVPAEGASRDFFR
jgi:hypothetical protein